MSRRREPWLRADQRGHPNLQGGRAVVALATSSRGGGRGLIAVGDRQPGGRARVVGDQVEGKRHENGAAEQGKHEAIPVVGDQGLGSGQIWAHEASNIVTRLALPRGSTTQNRRGGRSKAGGATTPATAVGAAAPAAQAARGTWKA